MFVRLDHVGVVAYSIEEAQAILGDHLGLTLDKERPEGGYFAPEQTQNYFFTVGDGETRVEVLIPTADATSGTARYLEKYGPRLHHLCYACRDVTEEAERLLAHGLTEIDLPRTADGRRTVAFFHPKSAGGILTEIVQLRT